MKTPIVSRALLSAALLILLAACDGNTDTSGPQLEAGLAKVSSQVRAASDKVREEIATGDIDLSSDDPDAPAAVITPQGELVIDGHMVVTDASQAALLREYRDHVEQIAQAGVEIGLQAAGVAVAAVGETLKGALSGSSEEAIKRNVEAQADGIKAQAAKLCDRIPGLIAVQDRVSKAVPEFRPYATTGTDDIETCRSDIDGISVNSD